MVKTVLQALFGNFAYMPHAGYEDVAVEEVYAGMSELRADAKEKRKLLAAGDFNAVVGRRRDDFGEDPRVLGVHGVGERNARGNTMVQWATAEGLCLIRTQCRKQFAQLWTHKNGLPPTNLSRNHALTQPLSHRLLELGPF